jgi:predicted nucleotidyltransferase
MKKNKTEIIKTVKDFLYPKHEILFCFVFGSFVSRDFYHDIDLAVYIQKSFNYNDLSKFPYGYISHIQSNLSFLLRENVDLIILNNSDLLLQKNVINNRIIVFEKDKSLRVEFENLVRKKFNDIVQLDKIKSFSLQRKLDYV